METYATSQQSDRKVAQVLNTAGYVTKQGKPFTTDMVREMLQNRTYIGQIRYQRYHQHPDGSRDSSMPIEWFEGQHQSLVPIELFERCQEVRRQRSQYPRTTPSCLVYPLAGLLYCRHCGKRLRAQKSPSGKRYYHCANPISELCVKRRISADVLEEEVARIIMDIHLPLDWRMEDKTSPDRFLQIDQRRKEVQQTIKRLDFRWDMG